MGLSVSMGIGVGLGVAVTVGLGVTVGCAVAVACGWAKTNPLAAARPPPPQSTTASTAAIPPITIHWRWLSCCVLSLFNLRQSERRGRRAPGAVGAILNADRPGGSVVTFSAAAECHRERVVARRKIGIPVSSVVPGGRIA